MNDLPKQLINDAGIAHLACMSRSWVRKERFLRRHGQPHVLDLDPIMIGSSPRYRLDEVIAWIEYRGACRPGGGGAQ